MASKDKGTDDAAAEQAARERQAERDGPRCLMCGAADGSPCVNPGTGLAARPHWSRTGKFPAPPKLPKGANHQLPKSVRPKARKSAKSASA